MQDVLRDLKRHLLADATLSHTKDLCLLENWDILAECYYSANLCFEILQFCFWLAGCAGGDQFIGNPIFGKVFTIVKETLKFFAISLLNTGILNIGPLFVKS